VIYSSLLNISEPKPHPTGDVIQLLHVGRIAKGKGQEDAILACQRLYDENIDFSLTLVGGFDESYKEEFLQFLENCTYKDKIKLVGHTKNVQSYIANSDIFIFPSHGEGLSNAFLEALSNNLVCISYNNTSFPELIKLDLHFKMVKNKSIKALQIVLFQIVNTFEHEQELSSKNLQKIKVLFSEEREIKQFLEILI